MMNPTRHEDTSPSYVNNYLSEERPKRYSSIELKSFTADFSKSNSIGSGGFAEVYKGLFPGGELRAVKLLNKMNFVEDTFMAEVRTMGNIAHRNLVKLCGYCFEDNMKALVYEYMENGSLDKILYEDCHGNIKWVKLYAIAIEIANGLKYLHHELDDHIIHHDIKAANVLLDKNFSAKIADFGLARIMDRDVSRVDLSRTRGTPGYSAPEAWRPQSQVTSKCDVYSFGMLLFEILGKRNNGEAENWFPGLVWNQFENGNLEHYITTNCSIVEKDKENANTLCKVAFWCVQDNPDLRPSMKEVVLMLEKVILVKDPLCPSSDFKQFYQMVDMGESRRENIEREQSKKMELDPTYPQNITVGPTYESVAGSDDGVTLPQLKSNKRKTRSPNREEDLATLEPNKGMKLPTTKVVGKTTPLKYKKIILELVAKDEAVTIGVYGMGGVGKTTIFKDVYNQLLVEPNRFDKIIWVVVSKDSDIKKLQNDIAKELDLNLSSEDDVDRRSRLLLQALEKRKSVVFFFDDMWKKISLDKIGIPEPTQENGFKLILTTRLLDVCRKMGCHKGNIIKVEGLPKDEAWELLMDKIDCVLTPEVEEIVQMVAKKCFGLPLAIITVGGAMRGNIDKNDWTVALHDLNLKDPSNRTMGMEDDVYECLKFSYDRLENDKQRKCFLCCALYPEDWEIETGDLVDFWIMDGLVEGTNRQIELVEGQCILNRLKAHCLLETVDEICGRYGEMSDGVKMHDLIREMALRLTSKCFLVKGPRLMELPNEEEWEIDLEKASFMDSEISTVSISPMCPKLSTLILRNTAFLWSVTHNFFVQMKCLKVLELRCFPNANDFLELLPDSISDLVNLRVLCLSHYFKLKKLPSLAKLVLLRRLELNYTSIEVLPEGLEMLVNLRCLNLQAVQLKERIPIGLISKFSLLQELYLGGIDVDKLYEDGRGKSFAKELSSLTKLENLSVTFHCLSDYVSYVGSPEFNGLKCFFLTTRLPYVNYIGPHNFNRLKSDRKSKKSKCLYVRDPVGGPSQATIILVNPFGEDTAFFILPNTKRLQIDSFNDVKRLNELGWLIKDVEKLVSFRICLWKKLECIWSSKEFSATGTSSTCWLRSLETIIIWYCPKLDTIFEGIPISSGVFCLKELTITNCANLKKVFPSSRLLKMFQNLENISIQFCDELEELIEDDEEEETESPIAIPKLKYLSIGNLPKLKRICRDAMICDSLKLVEVTDCLKLKRLPQIMGVEQSTPPALLVIRGYREWWDSLEWDPFYPRSILQPFFEEGW